MGLLKLIGWSVLLAGALLFTVWFWSNQRVSEVQSERADQEYARNSSVEIVVINLPPDNNPPDSVFLDQDVVGFGTWIIPPGTRLVGSSNTQICQRFDRVARPDELPVGVTTYTLQGTWQSSYVREWPRDQSETVACQVFNDVNRVEITNLGSDGMAATQVHANTLLDQWQVAPGEILAIQVPYDQGQLARWAYYSQPNIEVPVSDGYWVYLELGNQYPNLSLEYTGADGPQQLQTNGNYYASVPAMPGTVIRLSE